MRWPRVLAAAVAVVALGGCLGWRADGGTWVHVESPSMGTAAPVGSLLWVGHVDPDRLRPGDFITFRAPTGGTYSHRVLTRHDDGTLATKGDLPGPDPWRTDPADVVGEVRATWPGVGWLVVAAPLLLPGLALVLLARGLVRRDRRLPVTMVLGAVVVSVVLAVYRPLLGAEQVAFVPAGAGARATYVGTGLLPVRLHAEEAGGESVVLRAGEVGSVHVRSAGADGDFRVGLAPDLPRWWWLAVVLGCLTPAAVVAARGNGVKRLQRNRGTYRKSGVDTPSTRAVPALPGRKS
ncbi:hypothetical protein [Nocardioides sp. LML1-1-1.1]|uniref:hypothetical protein n=1 Tax=Nocardioides sp. LML1-1-1.1 TaxID=3135248 RepID=UPI0034250D4F